MPPEHSAGGIVHNVFSQRINGQKAKSLKEKPVKYRHKVESGPERLYKWSARKKEIVYSSLWKSSKCEQKQDRFTLNSTKHGNSHGSMQTVGAHVTGCLGPGRRGQGMACGTLLTRLYWREG